MVRLLGGVLIISSGLLLRGTILRASRRELETQRELRDALLLLEKEIKFTLMPLPKLLRMEFGCCVSAFFSAVSDDLCSEKTLSESWQTHTQRLFLPQRIKLRFARLGADLVGEEESIRRTLLLMAEELSESMEAQERTQRERERLTTALCLSGSFLLVLVLL